MHVVFTFFPSSVFMYVLLQPLLNYSVYFTCMYALMNVNMYSTYIHTYITYITYIILLYGTNFLITSSFVLAG